jgi:DNA-binding HxlR family transcriptional regulator
MPTEGNGITLTDHLDRWGMKVCPIDRSLKIMGQRYALHIMRNMLLLKQNRFNQFLNSSSQVFFLGEAKLVSRTFNYNLNSIRKSKSNSCNENVVRYVYI